MAASSYQYLQYLKYIKNQKVAPVYLSSNSSTTSVGPISFSDNIIGLNYSSPLVLKQNSLTLDACANYMFDGSMVFTKAVTMTGIPLVSGDIYAVTIDPITKRLAYQTQANTNLAPNEINMASTGHIKNVGSVTGQLNTPIVLQTAGPTGSLTIKAAVGTTVNSIMTMDNTGNIVLNGNNITIGNPDSVVNILGTQTSVTSSTVTDQLIILNKDGNTASSYGSGIAIEANGINVGYIKVDSVGGSYDVKVPNNSTNYTMMLKDPNGNMNMTGNLSINTNKFVVNSGNGNMTIAGTATILKNLNMNGELTCVSGCYISGGLDLFGAAYLNGSLTRVGGTIDVSGAATLRSNTSVGGTLTVTNGLSVGGSINSNGMLNTGNSTVVGGMSVGYNAHIGGNLSVTGTSTLTGRVTMDDLSLNGSLISINPTAIFKTAGNAAIGGRFDVSGAANINGNTTMGGNLIVSGDDGLRVASDAMIYGGATIGGDTVIGGNATINGNTILSGSTTFTGKTGFNDDIYVGGDISASGYSWIGGASTIIGNTSIAGRIDVSGGSTIGGDVTIGGSTTIGNNASIVGIASILGNTTIGGTVTIGQKTTLNGFVELKQVAKSTIGQNANMLSIDPASGAVYYEPHNKYTAPLISDTSNNISITQSSALSNGYLSLEDWATFNGKQNVISSSAPLSFIDNVVSISQSSNVSNGYLSASDWSTFNAKQPTVSSYGPVDFSNNIVSMGKASASAAGYLSPGDWTVFNAKQATVSSSAPLDFSNNTVTIRKSSASSNGYLSAGDWSAFNAKQEVVSSYGPVDFSNNIVSMGKASGSAAGYLSPSDWTVFNTKQDVVSSYGPVDFSNNIVSMGKASASGSGYLSSGDWSTFNTKQASVLSSAPLDFSNNTVTIRKSSASSNGFLSSDDWSTFNAKQATVSSYGPVDFSNNTISMGKASASSSGYLSAADWVRFDANQGSSGAAAVFTSYGPIDYSNNVVSIGKSTASSDGYLSSADWNTFNNKQTTITASNGVTKNGNNIELNPAANVTYSGTNVWNGSSTFNGSVSMPNLTDISKSYMLFYDNANGVVSKAPTSLLGNVKSSDTIAWSGKHRFVNDVSFNNTTTQVTSSNITLSASSLIDIKGNGILNVQNSSVKLSNIANATTGNVLYYNTNDKTITYGTAPSGGSGGSGGGSSSGIIPNVVMTSIGVSGDYTVPENCIALWIKLQGAGGGGGGSNGDGGDGSETTVTSGSSVILRALGGDGGQSFLGGAGGYAESGNIVNTSGNNGSHGYYNTITSGWEAGGNGGNSMLGVGGSGGFNVDGNGSNGENGSGGGGAAGNAPLKTTGCGGGGSGGYAETLISSPSGTYTISIGSGGVGGIGNGTGCVGGAGGDAKCIIFAYISGTSGGSGGGSGEPISLNNTTLTGIPTAPTAAVGTSTAQLATTAFVNQSLQDNTMSPNVIVTTIDVSGDYTVPEGCISLWVKLQGAGGGGGGSSGFGTLGTATTISTLGSVLASADGGYGGLLLNGGNGGTSIGANISNIDGNSGSNGSYTSSSSTIILGGAGGSSQFSQGGQSSNTVGLNGSYGSGGGGAPGYTPSNSAGGGGAGGYCETMITSPAGTYTINIGTGGAGGSGERTGGAGGNGKCVIFAYVNGLAALSSYGASTTTSTYNTAGTYTFTVPFNCASISIRLQGAGGGGAGGNTNGGVGGQSTITGAGVSMTANGGNYGSGFLGGTGGTSSGGTIISYSGGQGVNGTNISSSQFWTPGGNGGNGYFGSGGLGGTGSTSAAGSVGLYGAGGGGGVGISPNLSNGGGGAGGYCETMINNPNGTYTITLGAGGAGGDATTNVGSAGGAGGDGMCVIVAYMNGYQSVINIHDGDMVDISSANVAFKSIPSATKANVLYYDTVSKKISYGAAPTGGSGSSSSGGGVGQSVGTTITISGESVNVIGKSLTYNWRGEYDNTATYAATDVYSINNAYYTSGTTLVDNNNVSTYTAITNAETIYGMSKDGSGNIYTIKTTYNGTTVNTLEIIYPSKTISAPISLPGYNTNGGMVVYGNTIYIASDTRIIAMNRMTLTPTTYIGGAFLTAPVDGNESTATFVGIKDITVDSYGNLYVTDSGYAYPNSYDMVRKIDANKNVTTLAGGIRAATITDAVDGTGTNAKFYVLKGITCDSNNNLYVCENYSSKIRKITSSGVVTTIATINAPSYITIDNYNKLYITSANSNSITRIDLNTTPATDIIFAGSTYEADYMDGYGTDALFNSPKAITYMDNNLYVIDSGNQKLRNVELKTLSTVTISYNPDLSGGVTNISGDVLNINSLFKTNVTSTNILNISGGVVTVNSKNSKYKWRGAYNSAIEYNTNDVYSLNNAYYTASYTYDINVSTYATSNFGVFNDIVIHPSTGNIYVSSISINKILKIAPNGTLSVYKDLSTRGMTIVGNTLYACVEYTIVSIDLTTGTDTIYAGSTIGYVNGNGTSARFVKPRFITSDKNGNLYVVDINDEYVDGFEYSMIRKIDIDKNVTTFAGNQLVDYTSSSVDGTGTNATFRIIMGIICDSNNNIYVCEGSSAKLRKITQAGVVTTIINNDPILSYANYITIDNNDNLYILSYSKKYVSKVVLTPTPSVTIIAGSTSNTSGDMDGIGTTALFTNPICITYGNNQLYLTDVFPDNTVKIKNISFKQFVGLEYNPDLSGGVTNISGDILNVNSLYKTNVTSSNILNISGETVNLTGSVYIPKDAIAQGAYLTPSDANKNAIVSWLTKSVNTVTPVAGVSPFWSTQNENSFGITISISIPNAAYSGGVYLPDGRVVFVPYNANTIGIFNPYINTYSTIDRSPVTGAYSGGVLLPDGRVLFVPHVSSDIGIFNPLSNSFSTISTNISVTYAYSKGVLLPNGRVVFVPSNSGNIGIFNPTTNSFNTIATNMNTANAYSGGVLLPNGRVVFVPYSSNKVCIFDYISNTYSEISTNINTANAYSGGVLLPDGRVLFVPHYATNIGIFNPNTYTFSTVSADVPGNGAFDGGVLLPDGRVFFFPYITPSCGIFNPVTGVYSSIGNIVERYNGGVLIPDGRVVIVPHFANNICIFSQSVPASKEMCLHPFFNKF